jgi:hypothetical protein
MKRRGIMTVYRCKPNHLQAYLKDTTQICIAWGYVCDDLSMVLRHSWFCLWSRAVHCYLLKADADLTRRITDPNGLLVAGVG